MLIVGLDLAGSDKRETGFCVLEGMKSYTMILHSDKEIINEIKKVNPDVITIDAPLSLPPGRKSIEERNDVHFRECDRELLRRKIKFFPVTLGPMRKLTERGINLKNFLKNKGFKVIEVYPGGAQDILKIPRKQKGLDGLRKGLEKLEIKGLTSKMNDHELDAVTCAYVGKMFLEGKSETLGILEDGIVMPK